MSDIHALSGAFAVDALDDAERQQFEQHLRSCAECRAEVRSFSETTALLAETEAQTPPASLRESVLAGIGSIRPLPPLTTPEPPVERTHRRTFPMLVAAAVALILLAVGGGLVYRANHDGSSTTDLAQQVLAAPDATRVTEPVPGGGTLTLVRSESLGRAVLEGQGVPAAKAGTTYQMWLQQPGQGMVSAGLMPDAEQPTLLTGDAATAEAAAVSVEPEGGSRHPTTKPLALFALPASGAPSGGGSSGPGHSST